MDGAQAGANGATVMATVPATTVAFALSRGMTPDEVMDATSVPHETLLDPNARLDDQILPALWNALTARHPGLCLSIEMARAAPFSLSAGLAFGAQFAAHLGAALHLFVQNSVVLADRIHLNLQLEEHQAAFTAFHPLDSLDRGRSTEVGLALLWRVIVELLRVKGQLRRVEFVYPPAGPEEAYRSFFSAPVLFGQPRNALVFPSEMLERPVSQANVKLFAFVEKHFEMVRERLERTHYPPELAKLRDAIAANGAQGQFAAGAAVARAHLSLRSAQRLAATHGTSLRDMIEDVRAEFAKEYLNDPKRDLLNVALLVGYSDERSFRRAFKRWTGMSPSGFRNQGFA